MGGKASRLRDNVRHLMGNPVTSGKLIEVYDAVKVRLIGDLTNEGFADMYAQTLTYGLFAARYYDKSSTTFSRGEARDLLPASNPLLQQFFDHIAGAEFEKSLTSLVDELCEIFRASDVHKLVHDLYRNTNLFGELEEGVDPIVHFYEDFLREYDPKEKVERGVFYTPLPVVRFIVRSVNEILKNSFGATDGLADTEQKGDQPRVQILDPAVGTGTFLSEVIRTVHESFAGQEARWKSYVESGLIPRLFGFELMMAPYTIAHLKLSLLLAESGASIQSRLNVFLTNSLEPAPDIDGTLFSLIGLNKGLADEAIHAGDVKKNKRLMAVIGNPPYSGESFNKEYKGHDVYKFEPGTKIKLKEKNSKWINDDYVKFIRFAEVMVEKTDEGIVGMITAHGWIENPTFRGMRRHLLQTFDEIFVLDLHGNANKKEKSPDGSADKNVFDIKQGVAILLAIKTNKKKVGTLAKVKRFDLQGSRGMKFDFLKGNTIESVQWVPIVPSAPNYEFLTKDANLETAYAKGFSVSDLFPVSSVGIVTARDHLSIRWAKEEMEPVLQDFLNEDPETLRVKYDLGKDVQDWSVARAKKDVQANFDLARIIPISYRPFDTRWTFYTGNPNGFQVRPRAEVMKNFFNKENIGLVSLRQVKSPEGFSHILASSLLVESSYVSNKTGEIGYFSPLYLYSENGTKVPNLDQFIVKRIEEIVGKTEPQDIFDYVYAALHSPTYRTKYEVMLKRDFPRVPYPKDKKQFSALVEKGKELRLLHTMERIPSLITTCDIKGDNIVEKAHYEGGKVYINTSQYFGGVPDDIWNMYIGGYQPAQKWLKDKKGRVLLDQDLKHYQEIIAILAETRRIMAEIDELKGELA